MGTITGQPYSIVALTSGPDGVVGGSILLQGRTHALEHQSADIYALYEVKHRSWPPHWGSGEDGCFVQLF